LASTNTEGLGKYVTWGYLPHEDKYNHPTIEGRNAAVIMKSGVYDGKTDSHKLMDQSFTREDTLHAWYDEAGRCIRSIAPRDQSPRTISTIMANIPGRPLSPMSTMDASSGAAGAPARRRRRAWRKLAASRSLGARHVPQARRRERGAAPFRSHARGVKIYREMERVLRELRLGDEWYIKPKEKDGRGWGATEAIRGALCHWIEVQGGKIKNYQMIAPRPGMSAAR